MDEPSAWRTLKSDTILLEDLGLVCMLAQNTLTSVEIYFCGDGDSSEVESTLDEIRESSNTLKRLKFTGHLVQVAVLQMTLKLASKCINLEQFEHNITEGRTQESSEPPVELINLDEYDFKASPSKNITLSVSRRYALLVAKGKFFSKASRVKLDLTSWEEPRGADTSCLSAEDLRTLMTSIVKN